MGVLVIRSAAVRGLFHSEMLPMLDIDTIIFPQDQSLSLRFKVKEADLASAMSAAEALDLVDALAAEHGVTIFKNVAEDVIDEYAEETTDES